MRRTQKKHLFKTIQKNIVSFLAVAMMAATGIAIYLGDQSAAKAILEKANTYFVENQLQSLEISSVYGMTEEDIEALAQVDGIDEAEGGYSTIGILETGNETGKVLIRVHSLLENMNLPVVVEGTLPESENQAAIEQKMATQEGIEVGDTIVVEHDGELKTDTFLVTAIINQPSFCCGKSLDTRGMSDKGIGSAYYYIALPKEAFDASYYSNCYTTAYVKNYELDQYNYFSDEYKEKEAALKEQVAQLGKERAAIRFEQVRESANEAIQETETMLVEYDNALQAAREMVKDLGITGKYYDKMLEELDRAEAKIKEGWDELQEAKEEVVLLEEEAWVVSIRNDIGDVRSIDIIVEGLYGLSYSMALIFVVVSVTVCYSAISRMISEQRTHIGMQKALGFTSREIMQHYMSYSILCGLCGVLEGWIFSILSVQLLNLQIYQKVFLLGEIPLSFSWQHAIIISVFFMIIFMIASFAACKKEIALPATELLRGETLEREKPFFFEKFGFYKKSRLYTRTMIKNVLGDTPRMMTTVVGVAGCVLLLVISFTMLLAMQDSSVVQFENYFLYEERLVVDTDNGNVEAFESILGAEDVEYIRIQDRLKLYREPGGNWSGAHVVAVSDAERLKEFMVLENPDTREPIALPETGMLVSLKCMENYDLKEGDVLEIADGEGAPQEVLVAGEIEHYLPYNLFVMSEAYYEEVMGEEADRCVFLLKGNTDDLYDKVKDIDGFLSLRDNSEYIKMDNALYLVVAICFVFAAIMAVLVMLNQNVMHITRKAKELSVMRINGFTMKETKAFVSRDNVLLTSMGILLGWVLGMIFGYVVIRVLEVAMTHYVRTPSLTACLISATIGGVFAYIMNKIALRRIKKLNLTNVNAN
ncbi:MAG: ABC transporter permease [Roseburia sp.]|nr:ABC transporter permease [Roseburia sp.]